MGAIEAEAQAARRAGLPASFVRRVGLPYPVAGAVHLEDQAQFHPRRYLLGLAELIRGDGSHVLELTRALAVDEAGVRTDRGSVRARDVLVATQVPIVDRGVFFAKAHPHRSYAIAARIRAEDAPDGMFINAGKPTRSLRTASDEDGLLLLVGGQGHRTGDEPDTESRYRVLEGFAREHFGANEFPYRWSTQDYMPVDGLPYVGRLTRRSRHVYVATGFQKWGMTNGTAAAIIVADLIAGRDNPWSRLFDANRLTPRASLRRFVQENASVALHFVGDRLRIGRRGTLDDVAPGEGRILLLNGRRTAIYRDDDGAVHLLSPSCTHLGCLVAWNPAERSWDCPCHGSRFAADGMVIQGPAVEDLRPAPPNEGLRTPARSRY